MEKVTIRRPGAWGEESQLVDIPVHPVASLFPMLPDDEMEELANDIRNNGQMEPAYVVEIDDELWLIDGRNRAKACELAGVELGHEVLGILGSGNTSREDDHPEKVEVTHENIGEWIMSKNVHRRHLKQGQKAAVAAGYVHIFEEAARKRMLAGKRVDPGENLPQGYRNPKATDQAGALLGVSGRSVRTAKKVQEADPELFNQVRDGTISASGAEKSLRTTPEPTPAERLARQIISKGPEFEAEVIAALAALK